MRRDLPVYLAILLGLAFFASLAWFSHHPESRWLDPVEDWPWIGPRVAHVRGLYLDDPPDVDRPEWERPGLVVETRSRPVVRRESRAHEQERLWLLRGTPIHARPEAEAPVVGATGTIQHVSRLERRGDWYRVFVDGVEGWVLLPGYDRDDGEPPYGSDPEPPRPLPPRDPDPEEMAKARELLGERERTGRLGPYELFTDLEDGLLLETLDRLAGAAERVYRTRYGVDPIGSPRAALVVYRDEGTYRLAQARSRRLFGLTPSGHTAYGLAVFFRGDRQPEEVGATLVHELTHLLNRRALGPALPPWIDEGICDDLAYGVTSDGRLEPSRIHGVEERARSGNHVLLGGGWGSLWVVDRALRRNELPALREVLDLGWEEFVSGPEIQLRYALSALLVHYLLEGHDEATARGFRDFLRGIAAGGPATIERLEEGIGSPVEEIDGELRTWVSERGLELRSRFPATRLIR